jgi:citrate lyase subunit beta/citryl-CoA lyase
MERSRRRRRSMLYIPGNNPAMLQHAGVYGADGILLDLEDAVATTEKDAARILVRNMLRTMDYLGCEVAVRVNHLDTPFGLADIEEIVPLQPDALRIPKIESVRSSPSATSCASSAKSSGSRISMASPTTG